MNAQKKYKLIFSKGNTLISRLLKEQAKSQSLSIALFVPEKLYSIISEKNKEILSDSLPANLQLAYVNSEVNLGVFLKPEVDSIETGTFIGIYAGRQELVRADPGFTSPYGCEIAQGISLTKGQLKHVVGTSDTLDSNEKYSIQINAFEIGNFTRFINHSTLRPNIKALLSCFPDGRLEILFFAFKKIQPGEQLLLNYGELTWKVFGVIPQDITPTSYMLDALGKVSPFTQTSLPNSDHESPVFKELSLKLAFLKLWF